MTERGLSSEITRMPWYGIAILILTAGTSLAWSSYVPIAWDEYLSLWTDRLPTAGQIIEVQRSFPISVDPIVFHVVAHFAVKVFGPTEFAMRLPALVGFLTMQICLFVFLRRFSSERAAVFALALPALTASLFYSFDGRPYGLLLGFSGLAVISWQSAIRKKQNRIWPLIGLTLSIALCVNVHYFGVLIFVPLGFAELFRVVRGRQLDLPVLAAMATGATSIFFVLPFTSAADEFRLHYCCKNLQPRTVLDAYVEMVTFRYEGHGSGILQACVLASVAAIVLWSCIREMRRKSALILECEFVFLVVFAALPFFGYFLASHSTNVLEPRYVLCSGIGIVALVTIGLTSIFRHNIVANMVLVGLCVGICLIGFRHIREWRRTTTQNRAALNISPEIRAAVLASSTGKLYFQDAAYFAFANYYEADEEIRSRLVLVYSKEQELKWLGTDTYALTALHMRRFTDFEIQPYESLTSRTGDLILVSGQDPDADWVNRAIREDHAKVKNLGSAFGKDVMSVRFPDNEIRVE